MKRLILSAGAIVLASPALAHVDPAMHGSFLAGMTHPIFGADHILAMFAVGLLAAMLSGRAVLAVPMGFVGSMAVGFLLAVAGLSLPLVEPMILASGLVIGGLVLAAWRMPLAWAVGAVGFFGLFHGFAHGTEIGGASVAGFAAGFVIATAMLHAVGVFSALALQGWMKGNSGVLSVRVLGGLMAIGAYAFS